MNPRSTLILALVAAALGAFVYLYEIRGADERVAAEDAANAVFAGVEAEAIDAFELTPEQGRPIRLERSEGRWSVVAPVAFPADAIGADGIASALAELQAERVFEEHEPLAAYGLEGEPTVRFWVGEQAHALRIGNAAPLGSETYVTDAPGERVFSVPTFKTTAFGRSLDELREKRVLDFDRSDVRGLEVSFGAGRVALEKRDGSWQLTAPLAGPADEDTVDGLLSDLEFLRAASFHDEEPDPAGLGLDAPWYQAALLLGGDERVTLVLGSENEEGQRIAVGAAGPRYWVAAANLLDWPRTITAFRDRQVARFASVDAESFTLAFRGEDAEPVTVEVERSDEGWSASPEPMAPGKASGILAAIANLKAADIAADELGPDELAALGLAPPRVSIGVEDGDGSALATVELGALQEGRGVPARRAGEALVFWLDASIAETLPLDHARYRASFASAESESDADPEEPLAEPAGVPGADAPDDGFVEIDLGVDDPEATD